MLALLDAWFIAPFDYGFMRRAVVGGLALSLAAPPLASAGGFGFGRNTPSTIVPPRAGARAGIAQPTLPMASTLPTTASAWDGAPPLSLHRCW